MGHFPAETARISEELTSLTAMVGEGKEITDWCPSQELIGAKLMDFDGDGRDGIGKKQIRQNHPPHVLGT